MSRMDVEYAGVENLDVMEHALRYNRHIADLMSAQFRPQGTLLDFGAGRGTFSRLMRARGYRVDCLDIDARYRDLLAAEGFATHAGLEGVPDASLDGVYLLNVLEHIEHDVDALGTLQPKLRPGGRIFIYVPAFQLLYSSMDRAIGHHRRYTKQRLARALAAAGFAVSARRYHDSLGFLAALLYKAVGDRGGRIDPAQIAFYDRVVFPVSRTLDAVVGAWFGKNVSAVGTRAS